MFFTHYHSEEIMEIKTFGEWLKAKLLKHDILQKDLAKDICVSKNTVTSWITADREPNIRNFFWVCRIIAEKEEVHYMDLAKEAGDLF
jgi:transcriptional regulator with XRE-family HTH domain